MDLQTYFTENSRTAVAFSGGADSAYLLYAARRWGKQVKAYYVKTPFQPVFELRDAIRLAGQLDVPMEILKTDVLLCPSIASNPTDRCYHCKRMLFAEILDAARRDGFSMVVDGTNASDDASDRPGMRALAELSVQSPLRLCGLSKDEIRRLSREAGLFTHDKPAYACLATRIATGEVITEGKLRRTERAEAYLTGLGFRNFRVRSQGDTAKIQVREKDLPRLLETRTAVLEEFKHYYSGITLDLEVRNEQ